MTGRLIQNTLMALAALIIFIFLLSPAPVHSGENILRLLVWEGYTPEKYIEEFEKEIEVKYGRQVTMDISYVTSNNDFFDPIRDKSVDLVAISHHIIKDERFNFIEKNLILPFDLRNIPNHTNVIPDIKFADFHLSNRNVYGVPVANGPYGLAYNTEKFKQAPQSWKILWDPAYKDKYVIGAHEYVYNANITAMVMGFPRESISSYDALNNKDFKEKLRKLAVNAHSLWIGVDKPDDLIGMSLAASWGDSLSALQRRGEIWKMADPVEGTIWWIDEYAMTGALADKPFLKKVAEEWINKSLSANFQINHLIREVGIYPVVTNITNKLTDQEIERVQIGEPGSFMAKHILQTTYTKRDRNGLKLLWDEAIKGILIGKGQ